VTRGTAVDTRGHAATGRTASPNGAFWLEDAADDMTPRAPLDGPRETDVAIVGAGFTGLWTARELLRRDPSLDVLVIEARTAGFGASGRNGAWLAPGIAVTNRELVRRSSPEIARATVQAIRDTVRVVADACTEDGIDAQVRLGGTLRVAIGDQEASLPAATLAAARTLGVEDDLEVLDAEQLAARVRIADARGALRDRNGAAVHPGRLVRGLARTVERLGGHIVEDTRVTDVVAGRPGRGSHGGAGPLVRTMQGDVRARQVVLANEAWLSQLPGQRRRVMPLYSLIILTEPIDDATWRSIGWDGHELLSSHRLTVDYLSRTVDGRILFGGRGAPYHFGSSIEPAHDLHAPTHERLRRHLVEWFPQLEGVRVSHAWGGPLGMPRDWMPNVFFDRTTGVGAAYGYTGQGVAATNLAGRILADLIVSGDTPHRDLPFVGHRSRRWEPEPLRWLATRYLQTALARLDARAERTGRPHTGRTLAERLMTH
jgi:glycine/D-amino acid oxidase-like deaminating enzyme